MTIHEQVGEILRKAKQLEEDAKELHEDIFSV